MMIFYKLRKAIVGEEEEIFALMNEVYDRLGRKDFLALGDFDYVKENIEDKGFTMLALDERERIVGAFICTYPMESEENLGLDIGLAEEDLLRVVHMDTAVVLPEARGNGLQYKMLCAAEKEIDPSRFDILLSTVSPENPASYKSLEKGGYRLLKTKEKYGGLIRRIYGKKLTNVRGTGTSTPKYSFK